MSDKDKMGTAITASGPAEKSPEKSAPPPSGGVATGGFFTPYRPNEGYATRLGMMAVAMAYVFFACHHWFYSWVFLRDFFDGMFRGSFLGFLTNWLYDPSTAKVVGGLGTVALASIGFAFAYRYIYANPRSAEFLIKTDGELGKVTWPKISPWFKTDTQVWGATYVVLLVVAFLTAYVFGVDMVLQFLANKLFYGG